MNAANRKTESANRQLVLFQSMISRWNVEADEFRRLARGDAPVSQRILDEVDRTRDRVREALRECDRIIDELSAGDQMLCDLLHVATAFEALSESLAISAEHLAPRVATSQEVAGLKYLLGELRKNAGLPTQPATTKQ